jgi:hypothetical protein
MVKRIPREHGQAMPPAAPPSELETSSAPKKQSSSSTLTDAAPGEYILKKA